MKAFDAWKIAKGENITIAIIDDGIEMGHPAFQDKIIYPKDMMQKEDGRLPNHRFTEKHGTPCASIACSADENAQGIAPAARVMPIRANSLGSIRQSEAIIWAVNKGADVISCSWGPPDGAIRRFEDDNRPYPIPDHLKRAFEYAAKHGRNEKGCPIVFAAGNGYEPISNDDYTSAMEVLAVTACNHEDRPTIYADYGFPVFCAFPSGDFSDGPDDEYAFETGIWVADRLGGPGYDEGDYYSFFSGTSASCPGVAGVIALMLSANPELTYSQIKELIKEACDKIGMEEGIIYDEDNRSREFGYGRLNAHRAVQLAKQHANTKTHLRMTDQNQKPQAISLHIGINHVDQEYYGNHVPELLGCVNDMNNMKAFAKGLGYLPHTLENEEATRKNIYEQIISFGNQVQDGGILLVTYAGHGTLLADTNDLKNAQYDKEGDGKDEAWVTYDGFLPDDEIFNCLAEIQSSIRVVVLSDSCHSESTTRGTPERGVRERRIKWDAVEKILYRNDQTLEELRAEIVKKRGNGNVAVLNLSACRSDETAKEENGEGVFTKNIIAVHGRSNGNGFNYQTFMEAVRQQVENQINDQTPNRTFSHLELEGFLQQKPFSTEYLSFNNHQIPKVMNYETEKLITNGNGQNNSPSNNHSNGKNNSPAKKKTSQPDEGNVAKELLLHQNGTCKHYAFNGNGYRGGSAKAWDWAYHFVVSSNDFKVDFVEPNIITDLFPVKPEGNENDREAIKGSGKYLSTYPPFLNGSRDIDFIWHLRDGFSELLKANREVFPDIKTGGFLNKKEEEDVVKIAHIDTGLLPGHPTEPKYVCKEITIGLTKAEETAIDKNKLLIPDFIEQQGHGQATASILAGNWVDYEHTDNRYKGFFGAIPYAKILPIKISESVVLMTGRLFAEAVDFAIDQGCDVITLSMAGLPSRVMAKAVDKAYEAGVVLVAAASNCWSKGPGRLAPKKTLYPARYDRAIAVVGCTHSKLPYINSLNKAPRSAGGEYMQSCYGPANVLPTTIAAYSPNITWFDRNKAGAYYVKSGGGTSSATPQVAAAAALYIQHHKKDLAKYNGKNAWKRVEIVRQALFQSAEESPTYKNYFGNGMLKAHRALVDKDYAPKALVDKIKKPAKKAVLKKTFGGIFHLYSNRGGNGTTENAEVSKTKKGLLAEMLMEEVHQLIYLDESLRKYQSLDFESGQLDLRNYPELLDAILNSAYASQFLKKAISQNVKHQSKSAMHGKRKVLHSKLGQTIVSTEGAGFAIYNEQFRMEGAGEQAIYIDEFELSFSKSGQDMSRGMASVQLELVSHAAPKANQNSTTGLAGGQMEEGDELHSVILVESVYEDGTVMEWQASPHARATSDNIQDLFPTHKNTYVLYSNEEVDRGFKKMAIRFLVKAIKWVVKKELKVEVKQELASDKGDIQKLADRIGDAKYELMIYDLELKHTPTKTGWQNLAGFPSSKEIDKGKVIEAIKDKDTEKKVLFVLPGLFSTVEKGFEEFLGHPEVRKKLLENHCRYIVGVNMPTALHGIEKNAEEIKRLFKNYGDIKHKPCNVIARSRGGLVARHLFELTWLNNEKGKPFDFAPFLMNNLIMTGTPNEGTKIASTKNWRNLFNTVINIAKFTVGTALPVVPHVLAAIKAIGLGITKLDGISDQEEDSEIINKLNKTKYDRKGYFVLTSNFEPQKGWLKRLFDEQIVDRGIFKGEFNDSVTPMNGAICKKSGILKNHQWYIAEEEDVVSHFSYLDPQRHDELVGRVLEFLA